MPRTRTRLQLRTEARAASDSEHSSHSSDDQVNVWIDQSAAALQALLEKAEPDRYLKSTTVTTAAGTHEYALPADFYRVRGVELVDGSNRYTLSRYELAERNDYASAPTWLTPASRVSLRYRIMKGAMDGSTDVIRFEPDPGATLSIDVLYTAAPGTFANDSATIDGVAGFEEYIVFDVAARILLKEGDPQTASIMLAERDRVAREAKSMAADRDAGSAPRVQDVLGFCQRWS